MIQIAVLGYGTVGSGVVEVIRKNQSLLERRIGEAISIKYILDRKDMKGSGFESLVTKDVQDILRDEEVRIVVEVMGGVEPAYTFVKQALEAGKNVVTSNKELVEKHGGELLELAKNKERQFLFEASVGGGIPIIRNLDSCLSGDEILEVLGILNGTTNYMLTKMFYEGADYHQVLKEAQEKGYAERNPKADVEGYDSCRKIAILTSIVSGKKVDYEDISCQGIREISVLDMEYAKRLKGSIKLVGMMKKIGETYQSLVAPFLLRFTHPLSRVDGVFNSVFVKGNMLGDAMFFGSGAGKLPTASAVVADVVEVAKDSTKSRTPMWSKERLKLEDNGKGVYRFFLRCRGKEKETTLLQTLLEGEVVSGSQAEEFGYLTKEIEEDVFLKIIQDKKVEILSWIRVLE